jgi:hypothetical protein
MTGSSKAKGDHYERELCQLLGGVQRQLGAGRKLDVGDIQWNGWCIQAAYRATPESLAATAARKWPQVIQQAKRCGLAPALALRLPRRGWWIGSGPIVGGPCYPILKLLRGDLRNVNAYVGEHVLHLDDLDTFLVRVPQ